MKLLLFTCPIPQKGYQAGLMYEVPDDEADTYLDNDQAILVKEEREIEEPFTAKPERKRHK